MASQEQLNGVYSEILGNDLCLTKEKADRLLKKGFKVSLISFEMAGDFLVKFNKDSINKFFTELRTHNEYCNYTISSTHFLEFSELLNDRPTFFAMKEKRALPDMTDALSVLDKAPWFERTSDFLANKIKRHDQGKIGEVMIRLIKP